MFLFKKLLGTLLNPVPLCLLLLLSGVVFLWATRRQRVGKTLVTLGTLLLAATGYPYLPDMLLSPLERRYPPLISIEQLRAPAPNSEPVKWIVVLSGLERLVEGVRLFRQLPGTKLIITGGSIFGSRAGAIVSAETGLNLGLNPEDMVLETGARDTEDEARLVKKIVGRDRFILVTSSYHMPRAMALFKKQGLEPIAGPAGSLVADDSPFNPWLFLPSADNVRNSEIAVHEYLGLAWAWLQGKI